MAKNITKVKADIDVINASTMTAKDKELAVTAYLALKVERNEDIVEDS